MSDNQIWNELVLDVIHAASIGMDSKDFEIQCRLAPTQNGKSFFDRVRVAEDLMRTGLIVVEDGSLKLVMKEVPSSLFKELKKGSEVGWKILDYIDHSSKLTQKIDLELIKQIGLDGELAVIEELKNLIPDSHQHRIKHISFFLRYNTEILHEWNFSYGVSLPIIFYLILLCYYGALCNFNYSKCSKHFEFNVDLSLNISPYHINIRK